MGRMSVYEKRVRERFPALVADPIWPAVENLVKEDWRDDDEYWFDGVEQQCIDLSKRLGLPFGPAKCGWCDELWPKAGDVPDGGPCPRCVIAQAAAQAEAARQQAAQEAWWATLSDEEKAEHTRRNRMFVGGLIRRNVQ